MKTNTFKIFKFKSGGIGTSIKLTKAQLKAYNKEWKKTFEQSQQLPEQEYTDEELKQMLGRLPRISMN